MVRRPRPLLRWLLGHQQAPADDGPPGMQVSTDLAYGDHAAQRLDVYRPAGRPTGPVLVIVHGGGWQRGDKAAGPVIGHKVAHWGARGWLIVSVGYRLWPEVTPREQAGDVARALAHVQRHAAAWGGDAARIALMGHSAGGHLAALVAADAALAAGQGAGAWPATVVVDTAALDVPALMQGRHLPQHDQVFGGDAADWPASSPVHCLGTAPASALLLVCSAGRPDSVAAADTFAARVQALGGVAQVLPVAFGHLQLNREIGRDPVYTAAVDAFLRRAGLVEGETPAGTPGGRT
jgi:acetyl esterase/lipase